MATAYGSSRASTLPCEEDISAENENEMHAGKREKGKGKEKREKEKKNTKGIIDSSDDLHLSMRRRSKRS